MLFHLCQTALSCEIKNRDPLLPKDLCIVSSLLDRAGPSSQPPIERWAAGVCGIIYGIKRENLISDPFWAT